VNVGLASRVSTTRWAGFVADRATVDVPSPLGGWGSPWPNVAEIEAALPHEKWTLVGGLMTQLHSIRAGIGVVRPTNDVDIVLHVETTRGVAAATATALESLGYELAPSLDPRVGTAHRLRRGVSTVDLVTGVGDVVDVLVATPSTTVSCRGRSARVAPHPTATHEHAAFSAQCAGSPVRRRRHRARVAWPTTTSNRVHKTRPPRGEVCRVLRTKCELADLPESKTAGQRPSAA
jgi:hypothetical protein